MASCYGATRIDKSWRVVLTKVVRETKGFPVIYPIHSGESTTHVSQSNCTHTHTHAHTHTHVCSCS